MKALVITEDNGSPSYDEGTFDSHIEVKSVLLNTMNFDLKGLEAEYRQIQKGKWDTLTKQEKRNWSKGAFFDTKCNQFLDWLINDKGFTQVTHEDFML